MLCDCVVGFIAGCRSLLGFDGYHLKRPYRGVLLAAIGIGANLQLFPLTNCWD